MLVLINPAWLRRGPRAQGRSRLAAVRLPWFARLAAGDGALAVVRGRVGSAADGADPAGPAPTGGAGQLDGWVRSRQRIPSRHAAWSTRSSTGMHLLLVSCEAPQMLTGEVEAFGVQRRGDGFARQAGRATRRSLRAARSRFRSRTRARLASGPRPRRARSGSRTLKWSAGVATNIYAGHPRQRPFRRISGRSSRRLAGPSLRSRSAAHLRPGAHSQPGGDLGDFIRQRRQYAVGGVLGPADYLTTTRLHGAAERSERRASCPQTHRRNQADVGLLRPGARAAAAARRWWTRTTGSR